MQNLPVHRHVTRAVARTVTGFLITLVYCVRVAAAQPAAPSAPSFASPLLPPDHWAVDAARRVATVGLASDGFGWADGTLTQAAVGAALQYASERARAVGSPLRDVIAEEWRRFAREFPQVAARLQSSAEHAAEPVSRRASIPLASSVEARFVSATGRLLPVRSLDRTRENVAPPQPLGDAHDAELQVRLGTLASRYFAAEVAGGRSDERWQLRDWQFVGAARSLGVWAGARAPDFGPGAGGGLVFDGRAVLDGGGVTLVNPVRAPWLFRHLGYIRGEAFLSRIDSSAVTRHPWVFGSHVSISPHPRLLLGATQAFMFSGEGQPPFTFRNFKEMFLTHGIKTAGREFENGIASIEARWRPPLPLPAILYAEWGTDDNHSAWFEFPAVVAGVTLPAVPRIPALSLGLERTSFAAPCSSCNGCACEYYATWYRHYVFVDGWTLDRRPIGHPLGGDGTEWLAYGRYDDAARRIRLDARGFTRDRGRYNLFAPTRGGRSVGGALGAGYRVTETLELRLNAGIERGRTNWSASETAVGLRWNP